MCFCAGLAEESGEELTEHVLPIEFLVEAEASPRTTIQRAAAAPPAAEGATWTFPKEFVVEDSTSTTTELEGAANPSLALPCLI